MISIELECRDCGWRTVCGEEELVRRLRKLGAFRRAPQPPEELVTEMLRTLAARLTCDRCGTASLTVREGVADDSDGDWEQVVVCEVCREPIAPERLAVLPKTRRCARCQDADDRNALPVAVEYCRRCGAALELRATRGGGLTRYKMFCTGQPPCRL